MNFNPTLPEYYDFFTEITVNETIIYYFYAYLFLSLAKKILKHEIGLDGILANNSSIPFISNTASLLTLSLIILLKTSLQSVNNYIAIDSFTELIYALTIFLFLLFLVATLLEKGLIKGMYRMRFNRRNKAKLKHFESRNDQQALDNHNKQKEQRIKHYLNNYKTGWDPLVINILVLTILIVNSFQSGVFFGLVISTLSLAHIIAFVKQMNEHLKNYPVKY